MRRLLAVLASLVLVGLIAGSASAGGDGKKSREHGTKLTFYAVETASTVISATGVVNPPEDDPDAFTAGTRFVSVDTLYSDSERTKEIGRNDIECTVVEVTGTPEAPGAATLLCHGVVSLTDQGTLAWQGSVTFGFTDEASSDEPFVTVALTGGTGAFKAAGGQAEIFDESPEGDETLSRYEVELLNLKSRK